MTKNRKKQHKASKTPTITHFKDYLPIESNWCLLNQSREWYWQN